jgi:hypothetical protein
MNVHSRADFARVGIANEHGGKLVVHYHPAFFAM